jgi:hypothetical protein
MCVCVCVCVCVLGIFKIESHDSIKQQVLNKSLLNGLCLLGPHGTVAPACCPMRLPLVLEDVLVHPKAPSGAGPGPWLSQEHAGYGHYSHLLPCHSLLLHTCLLCSHILVLVFTRSSPSMKSEALKFPYVSLTCYPSSPHADRLTPQPNPNPGLSILSLLPQAPTQSSQRTLPIPLSCARACQHTQ